ncbi:response regulator [Myxococcota bacterium]|jgi:DNA-binding NtrC family response regulator|nr:response regulator [Myxococcota bacterium]
MSTPHILIVDDEESVRAALRRSLRKESYRVSFAESATEALNLMKDDRPDLLITDHLMPQMTGLDLLRRVRLLYPDMARVILTGQAELDTVVAAINEGEIFRFLRKPWDETELKLTIHLALEQLRTERENRQLVDLLKRQAEVIKTLEKSNPGITSIKRDDSGAIIIDEGDTPGLT